MILAALLAACQDFFGQNPDRIRISKRVFLQDLPRNPEKCTDVRISRPDGTEIMSGQNFSPNKTGTLLPPLHASTYLQPNTELPRHVGKQHAQVQRACRRHPWLRSSPLLYKMPRNLNKAAPAAWLSRVSLAKAASPCACPGEISPGACHMYGTGAGHHPTV